MIPTPLFSDRLPDHHRRRFLAAAAALAASRPALLFAQDAGPRPTPAMTAGPFYPDILPAERDADLTTIAGHPARARGEILYLTGRVVDTRGRPLAGATIEIWQANASGRYAHTSDTDASGPLDPNFQGYAVLKADAEGRFRIKTIKPAPYTGRTQHLHFNVATGNRMLTTQMFFEGEKGNERDGLYRSLSRDDQRAATGRYADRARDMEPDAMVVAWDVVLRVGA